MPLRSTRKGRKSRRRLRTRKIRRQQRGGNRAEIEAWLQQLIQTEPYDLTKTYDEYYFDPVAYTAISAEPADPTSPARRYVLIPTQIFDATQNYEDDFLGAYQSLKTIAATLRQQCRLGEEGAKSLKEFLTRATTDPVFQAETLPALNQLEAKLRELLVTMTPSPSVEHLNKYQKPPADTLDIRDEKEQPALIWAVLLAAIPEDVAPILSEPSV